MIETTVEKSARGDDIIYYCSAMRYDSKLGLLVEAKLQLMNWRPSVCLLLVHSLLLSSFLVDGESYTSFHYPTFTSTDMLLFDRDAQFMPNTSSVWLNPSYNGSSDGRNYTCGSLIYAESIQMRSSRPNNSNGLPAVASFHTSFTFSITGRTSAGFAFMFVVNNHTTGGAGGQLCLVNKLQPDVNNKVLAVEFDTWQNPEYNDTSNNHVGVNMNSMNSVAFHTLCRVGISDCTYFVTDEGNPDQDFTSWIDYDSTTQSLEVFLTNGSTIHGVSKPANAIIQVPHLNVSDVWNDHMFVGFSGSGAMFKEVKKIKSWSFETRHFHEEGMPSISENPNSLSRKQIAGSVVGASVGGVILIGLGCKLFKVFGRPLRFFLSHAGGEDQEGKNFPDWFRDELTSSWKLKCFIKVFLDRRSLRKGSYFPDDLTLELEKTDVGVVVVTEEFFTRKWPMTELVAFVESQKTKNPDRVKLLPLFYRMSSGEVGDRLKEGIWEEEWTQMATNGNHPIPVEDCRNAVMRLCNSNGVHYIARDRGHDKEYIERILKEVGKIVHEEMWKRCLRWKA